MGLSYPLIRKMNHPMFPGIFKQHFVIMTRRKTLVLATHNIHKQKEIESILSDLDVQVVGLDQFPEIGEIPETGTTLEENAFIKAQAVFDITGLPSLADDTGLEVDALGGEPGVYSARYAGENATFSDNVNKMLNELKGVSFQKRTAKFRTVLALVDQGTKHCKEGVVVGHITEESRGGDGFGYDPIFEPNDSQLTFAEMDVADKNKISHRGLALINMRPVLVNHFKKGDTIE